MQETWKDIKGYEGLYRISNLGMVKTLDKYVSNQYGKYLRKGKVLKIQHHINGYQYITLNKNGTGKTHRIHRLVATAFIPNPKNKPQVNHIDEDIANNHASNLEWMTAKENANHGTRNIRSGEHFAIKVVKLIKDNQFVKAYDSIAEAAEEHGITDSPIIRVCKGKQKTSAGYKWMYHCDYLDMITRREVAI